MWRKVLSLFRHQRQQENHKKIVITETTEGNFKKGVIKISVPQAGYIKQIKNKLKKKRLLGRILTKVFFFFYISRSQFYNPCAEFWEVYGQLDNLSYQVKATFSGSLLRKLFLL